MPKIAIILFITYIVGYRIFIVSSTQEVVDISQSEIYQFDMTGQTSVYPAYAAYDPCQPPPHAQPQLDPQQQQQQPHLTPDYPMDYPQQEFTSPPSKKGKGGRKKSLRPPSPSVLKHRREAANARERKRMNGLNDAFERLREVVPNLTTEQKMSKIETLHMAQTYIKALAGMIEREEMKVGGTEEDFADIKEEYDSHSPPNRYNTSPGPYSSHQSPQELGQPSPVQLLPHHIPLPDHCMDQSQHMQIPA